MLSATGDKPVVEDGEGCQLGLGDHQVAHLTATPLGEEGKDLERFDQGVVLIVAHPQVTYTQAVLAELSTRGSAFIVCDRNRMPAGLLIPLDGHSIQTERLRKQIALKLPLRKRLWQQIVRAKIAMQSEMLESAHSKDAGLRALVPEVRSGDPGNVEARAARIYWKTQLGAAFRRDIDAEDENRFLNYGYAVLRAASARAICAVGLHPSLGLHHHNKYNSWCLADDIMELFRPLVDATVIELMGTAGDFSCMNQQTRAALIKALFCRVVIEDRFRTVIDACL